MRPFLYDAQGSDGPVLLDAVETDRLAATQLLWVDVPDAEELPSITGAFGLTDESVASIRDPSTEPSALVFDRYVHIAVATVPDAMPSRRARLLHVLVGENWVVTVHSHPVEFLAGFADRIRADSELGRLDSNGFLAAILQEHVTSYLTELRPIEDELDGIDLRSMTGRMDEGDFLRRLVRARVRLTGLRRSLEPHRELYALLSRTEFAVLSRAESVKELDAVAQFLDRVLNSMEATREMVASSFEIYTTWAAHGTNRLIRRLTVANVTILPPTLLAGIMGMNSLPGLFANGAAFWLTIAGMVGVASSVLTLAIRREWL